MYYEKSTIELWNNKITPYTYFRMSVFLCQPIKSMSLCRICYFTSLKFCSLSFSLLNFLQSLFRLYYPSSREIYLVYIYTQLTYFAPKLFVVCLWCFFFFQSFAVVQSNAQIAVNLGIVDYPLVLPVIEFIDRRNYYHWIKHFYQGKNRTIL